MLPFPRVTTGCGHDRSHQTPLLQIPLVFVFCLSGWKSCNIYTRSGFASAAQMLKCILPPCELVALSLPVLGGDERWRAPTPFPISLACLALPGGTRKVTRSAAGPCQE